MALQAGHALRSWVCVSCGHTAKPRRCSATPHRDMLCLRRCIRLSTLFAEVLALTGVMIDCFARIGRASAIISATHRLQPTIHQPTATSQQPRSTPAAHHPLPTTHLPAASSRSQQPAASSQHLLAISHQPAPTSQQTAASSHTSRTYRPPATSHHHYRLHPPLK